MPCRISKTYISLGSKVMQQLFRPCNRAWKVKRCAKVPWLDCWVDPCNAGWLASDALPPQSSPQGSEKPVDIRCDAKDFLAYFGVEHVRGTLLLAASVAGTPLRKLDLILHRTESKHPWNKFLPRRDTHGVCHWHLSKCFFQPGLVLPESMHVCGKL